MISTSRAAVLRTKGGPFAIEDVRIEPPRVTEVLVRVVATGLCHTDLLARDQILPPGPPAVLGHEGSGVVEAVGAGVRSVAVGDPVVLAPASCGRCVNCLGAHPMQCRTFLGLNLRGRRPDGIVKQIVEATGGGVDHAVDAVGLPQTVRNAVDVLNVGGSAAVVGSAGTGREVSLDISRLFGRTVTGVVEGDSVPGILIPQLVDLFMTGRFPLYRLMTRYGLAQVNEAAADAAAGRVVKPVLTH